jgi:hypothetical protein
VNSPSQDLKGLKNGGFSALEFLVLFTDMKKVMG